MSNKIKGTSLNRTSSHNKALKQSMSVSLILNPIGINTTHSKALVIRMYIEPLVTRAKNSTDATKLADTRYLLKKLSGDKAAVAKLMELSKSYKSRSGGYVRVLKNGFRKGDNAPMAYIQFV